MTYLNVSIFSLILFFQSLFFTDSHAQCSLKIEYKVESNSTGSSSLTVKSQEGSRDIKIQLYDMNSGKVVEEKKVNINDSFKPVFSGVKSSLYMFYIWLPGCSKPMTFSGDKHGILVEN